MFKEGWKPKLSKIGKIAKNRQKAIKKAENGLVSRLSSIL